MSYVRASFFSARENGSDETGRTIIYFHIT